MYFVHCCCLFRSAALPLCRSTAVVVVVYIFFFIFHFPVFNYRRKFMKCWQTLTTPLSHSTCRRKQNGITFDVTRRENQKYSDSILFHILISGESLCVPFNIGIRAKYQMHMFKAQNEKCKLPVKLIRIVFHVLS